MGAYAILRDSILVQSMTILDSATKLAHEYPIIVHSAEFIAKTTHEQLLANKPASVPAIDQQEDSLSDSSSSESDSSGNTPRRVSSQCFGHYFKFVRSE